jgi:disulfide bond formation protein DsbB
MSNSLAATLSLARRDPPLAAAAIVTIGGAFGIGGFFFFQYIMLLAPCPLCLEQRYAYYFCVPLAALLWLGASNRASRKVLLLGFLAIAAFMLWNAGLAAYHAGIEWKFWPGPADCTGPIDKIGSVTSMLNQLQRISLVRCDEAAWRFLGISLAGYDVLLSLALAAVAGWGAKESFARQE